jgi:hypothetical protein
MTRRAQSVLGSGTRLPPVLKYFIGVEGNWQWFSDLLFHARDCSSSDPRDKVYALHGLAQACLAQGWLDVNYAKSVKQVFAESMQLILEQSKTLDALCLVEWRKESNVTRQETQGQASYDGSVEHSFRGESLPSWVPDWTAKLQTTPKRIARFPLSTKGAKNAIDHLQNPVPLNVRRETDIVLGGHLTGSRWVLQATGCHFEPIRALSGGIVSPKDTTAPGFEWKSSTESINDDFAASKSARELLMNWKLRGLKLAGSDDRVAGRKLFVVDAYFGFGPPNLQEDDMIWKLQSATVFHALRREGLHYTFLGECYGPFSYLALEEEHSFDEQTVRSSIEAKWAKYVKEWKAWEPRSECQSLEIW